MIHGWSECSSSRTGASATTFLSAITATRSVIAYRLSRSWVIMNTVRSRLSDRSLISSSKAAAPIGSRPAVGSSRKSSSGSKARARARPARLRMPPDSSAGFSPAARAGRPERAIFRSANSSISRLGRLVCSNRGAATFSRTVRFENKAPCWKSTPQRRSTEVQWRRLAVRMSWPNSLTVPSSGAFRPMILLSSTDLPEPEPPTTPSTSPRSIDRSSPSWMTASPKRETSPST